MSATIVRLVQGTPEWLEYRRTMRNASETPAVLGWSPCLTTYELWLLRTGRKTQQVTAAMAHGTKTEPEARAAYEARTEQVMNPLVMQDGLYSASLDGINLAGDLILEIKAPFRLKQSTLWKSAIEGRIPAYYYAQVQHQLMVSGAAGADFWVYADGEGVLLHVHSEQEVMDVIRAGWDNFQQYLDTDTPPPLTEADSVQRDDPAWLAAAGAFIEAKRHADAADSALEVARHALVSQAVHPRETGGGVSVTRLWKQGSVDYKRVPALAGVDLALYRGAAREEVRVTVGK
jgi:putative phage-type endonuclease